MLVKFFCYVSFANRQGYFSSLFWPPSFLFLSLCIALEVQTGYCRNRFFENSKTFKLCWNQHAWFMDMSVPFSHILTFIHEKLKLGEKQKLFQNGFGWVVWGKRFLKALRLFIKSSTSILWRYELFIETWLKVPVFVETKV